MSSLIPVEHKTQSKPSQSTNKSISPLIQVDPKRDSNQSRSDQIDPKKAYKRSNSLVSQDDSKPVFSKSLANKIANAKNNLQSRTSKSMVSATNTLILSQNQTKPNGEATRLNSNNSTSNSVSLGSLGASKPNSKLSPSINNSVFQNSTSENASDTVKLKENTNNKTLNKNSKISSIPTISSNVNTNSGKIK